MHHVIPADELQSISDNVGAPQSFVLAYYPTDSVGDQDARPPNLRLMFDAYPILYRELFFFPLFLVEVSTISLLTLLPSMKISKYTLYSAAGMFFVFAV